MKKITQFEETRRLYYRKNKGGTGHNSVLHLGGPALNTALSLGWTQGGSAQYHQGRLSDLGRRRVSGKCGIAAQGSMIGNLG